MGIGNISSISKKVFSAFTEIQHRIKEEKIDCNLEDSILKLQEFSGVDSPYVTQQRLLNFPFDCCVEDST